MMGKLSLYGSCGVIVIAIYVMIGILGGAKLLFYSLLIPVVVIAFVYLLYKFLPEQLAYAIIGTLFIIFLHYFGRQWGYTIICIFVVVSTLLIDKLVKNEKWLKILYVFILTIFVVGNTIVSLLADFE